MEGGMEGVGNEDHGSGNHRWSHLTVRLLDQTGEMGGEGGGWRTCRMALSNLARSNFKWVMSGTASVPKEVGYRTSSGLMRLRGMNVTRPAFSLFRRLTSLVATSSVSTTIWKRAFPAET